MLFLGTSETVGEFEGRILAWNPAAQRMYGWSVRPRRWP